MSIRLEYVIKFITYLIGGFAGVWVSNLLFGTNDNPFTSVAPYIIASCLLIFSMGGKNNETRN